MTDYELSMKYERVYGHLSALHVQTQAEYNEEKKLAAKENREPDNSYEEKLELLKEQKAKFRKLSDDHYLRHKALNPRFYDEDALDNLIVAIMQRAALDYGTALSQHDLVAQAELERFANGYGQELTAVDMSNVFHALKHGYSRFCDVVEKHQKEILEDNKIVTRRHREGNRRIRYDRYRCPVCRGQILNATPGRKPKNAPKYLVFRCNHCNFFTEVMPGE